MKDKLPTAVASMNRRAVAVYCHVKVIYFHFSSMANRA